MAAALDALAAVLSGKNAAARVRALFALEFRLNLEPTPAVQSYGPRRVLYPQLTSMGEDAMGLGPDPALFRNRCLSDAFVELVEDVALRVLAG
jgi:hypothetical protein